MGPLDQWNQRLFEGIVIARTAEQAGVSELYKRRVTLRARQFGEFLGARVLHDELGQGLAERHHLGRRDPRFCFRGARFAQVVFVLLAVFNLGYVNRGGLFLALLTVQRTQSSIMVPPETDVREILVILLIIVNYGTLHQVGDRPVGSDT